jgi:ribosomal protein S21
MEAELAQIHEEMSRREEEDKQAQALGQSYSGEFHDTPTSEGPPIHLNYPMQGQTPEGEEHEFYRDVNFVDPVYPENPINPYKFYMNPDIFQRPSDREIPEATQMKYAGEPMDLAVRLLKQLTDEQHGQLLQEAEALRPTDRPTSQRFSNVARAANKPDQIRQGAIERYGEPAARLLGGEPELGELLYEEGRGSPDYIDMRQSPSNYPPEQRQKFFDLMRRLAQARQRVETAGQQAQQDYSQLREDDPSRLYEDLALWEPERDAQQQEQERQREAYNEEMQMGEPMDLAVRLLKDDGDPFGQWNTDDPEFTRLQEEMEKDPAATEQRWAQHREKSGYDPSTPPSSCPYAHIAPNLLGGMMNAQGLCLNCGWNLDPTIDRRQRRDMAEYLSPSSMDEHLPLFTEINEDEDAEMSDEDKEKWASEPMDLAFRMLKRATSPEALQHKVAYDEAYEESPERVKYREDLNRERRKRGIMGEGGSDVSHTEGGELTLESPHANRARHFAERGTLRPES